MESIKSSLVVTSRHSKAIAVISRSLLTQVQYLVKNVPTECQWFHSITKTTYTDGIVFRIDELIIPPQEVTGATVDSSPADVKAMSDEIKTVAGGYNAEYNNMLKRIKCWSHSHVNMTPTPSGTDEQTFKEYVADTVTQNNDGEQYPVGMFIVNKQNKYYLRIYDPELDLIFDGLTLHIEDQDVNLDYVDEAIKNKIVTKKQNFAAVYNQSKNYTEQYIYGTDSTSKKKSETGAEAEGKRDQKLQLLDAIFQKIYNNLFLNHDEKVTHYMIKQDLNRLSWSIGEYNLAKDILKAVEYYGPARQSYLRGIASKIVRNVKEYDPSPDFQDSDFSDEDRRSVTMLALQQLATLLVESKKKITMSHFQRLVSFLEEDMYEVVDQDALTELLIRVISGEKHV